VVAGPLLARHRPAADTGDPAMLRLRDLGTVRSQLADLQRTREILTGLVERYRWTVLVKRAR
jgi:hypothetical protein